MDGYSILIGKAILAGDEKERDLQTARYMCKHAASQHMFCPICNDILDQTTTVVFSNGEGLTEVMCATCATQVNIRGIAQHMADEFPSHKYGFTVETWQGGKEVFRSEK